MSFPAKSDEQIIRVRDHTFRYDPADATRVRVVSGAVIRFDTLDARCGRMRSPADVVASAPDFTQPFPEVDPATGPVGILGAEPGDTLKVTILRIALKKRGFVIVKPDMGVVRGLVDSPVAKMLPVRDGHIVFNKRLSLSIRPMIGIIGTAAAGPPIPSAYVHRCGGNMDNNRIRVGATVYLPVETPLALLYLGDVHAAMGDGEVCGLAAEISSTVDVRVEVLSRRTIRYPMVEDSEIFATTGIGVSFYEAANVAISQMIERLSTSLRISKTEAYMLASCYGDLRINQACDCMPIELGVRMEVPKNLLGLPTWADDDSASR